MMQDNIFQKIIDRQIKADIVYEDEHCLAFRDINAQAPVHVLIIPKKVIATHDAIAPADKELLGHLHVVAVKLAQGVTVFVRTGKRRLPIEPWPKVPGIASVFRQRRLEQLMREEVQSTFKDRLRHELRFVIAQAKR